MQDKTPPIIKFQGDETTYKLKGKVADFDHAKYGVKAGVSVDVSLDGEEVVFMRKSEKQVAAAPVKEEKQEVKSTSINGDTSVWTISGIPSSKEVIGFKEGKVKWYQVSEELKAKDWGKEGFVAKAQVKVTIGTVKIKDEDKPCVLTMQLLKKDEVKENLSPETEKVKDAEVNTGANNSDSWEVKQLKNKINYLQETKANSIERQSSWSSACTVVASLIQAGIVTPDEAEKVEERIKFLAEEGLKFVRS